MSKIEMCRRLEVLFTCTAKDMKSGAIIRNIQTPNWGDYMVIGLVNGQSNLWEIQNNRGHNTTIGAQFLRFWGTVGTGEKS